MIQWPCNYKNSPPIQERKKQRAVCVALYNTVTDLWRKRGFAIIKREKIQIYEQHCCTKVEHKWRYRQHCVRSDNRLSCRGLGGGGCADTRVSPCLWLAHRKYIGCCPLRDVVRTFRYGRTSSIYLLLVVTRITYLLTNVYLLSYVLIYIYANVFDPVFIYCLLPTLLRSFNFLHSYNMILCFAPCFLMFLYIYILLLRCLRNGIRHKKDRMRKMKNRIHIYQERLFKIM
jgi:hypothetical protein